MSQEESAPKKQRTEISISHNLDNALATSCELVGDTDWTKCFTFVKSRLGNTSQLEELVVAHFKNGGFVVSDEEKLSRLIAKIASGYNNTSYHNFSHATHVFLNGYILLKASNVDFSPVERAALLYSTIIHDIGHEGVPNAQLVKEEHPLAAKYEKLSVAENFSIDEGIALIEKDEYNALGCGLGCGLGFTAVEMGHFKHLVRCIVLATDIGNREGVQQIYGTVEREVAAYAKKQAGQQQGGGKTTAAAAAAAADVYADMYRTSEHKGKECCSIDSSKAENRITMLCLLMKLADVGSSFQHTETSKHWIHNFFCENSAAHTLGRGPEIVDQSFLEAQQGFFNGCVCYNLLFLSPPLIPLYQPTFPLSISSTSPPLVH